MLFLFKSTSKNKKRKHSEIFVGQRGRGGHKEPAELTVLRPRDVGALWHVLWVLITHLLIAHLSSLTQYAINIITHNWRIITWGAKRNKYQNKMSSPKKGWGENSPSGCDYLVLYIYLIYKCINVNYDV